MRGHKPLRALLLCLFLLSAAWVQADNGSSLTPNVVADLPTSLLELGRRTEGTAPRVLTAQRDLEHALSAYRTNSAAIQGSSLVLDTPVQVREEGLGTGVLLSWKQSMGSAQTTATVGLAAGYAWDEGMQVAPSVGVSVTVPLTGEAQVQAQRNTLDVDRAQNRYQTEVRAWRVALIEGYRSVQLALHDRTIADLKLTVARLELEGAQARDTAGGVSAAAFHSAQQGLVQAESQLAAAELQVEQALFSLRQLTGDWSITIDRTAVEYARLMSSVTPATDTAEAWVEVALYERDDVRLASESVALARAELELAQRKAGLTGQLTGGVALPASTSEPDALEWYVGAAFTLPLHDVATAERIKQAQLKYEQAVADRAALIDKVEGDVHFAYRQLALAEAIHDQALHGAQYAAELLERAEEALRSGVGTQLAVAEAQVASAEAQRKVDAAYYDVVIRRVTLWHMVGGDFSW